jgi:signal peptidase II
MPDTPKRDNRKYVILAVIVVITLILDQWTKQLVHTDFRWGESRSIIPSFFSLTYVRNTGAAFGLLHRAPAYFRDPFFIIVPVIALFVIGFVLFRLESNQKTTAVALSLIVGGAIGNLIDRLRFGFVVDFMDFYWKDYHWPAFNVADAAIVVGVSLMFLQSFKQGNQYLDPQGGKFGATDPKNSSQG